MNIEKKNLLESIEDIVSNGVAEMEEVDVTAGKITDKIWPMIDYLNQSNRKILIEFIEWYNNDGHEYDLYIGLINDFMNSIKTTFKELK